MQETLKYIRVLNWGYGGFAPITLNPDFKSSLDLLQKRLDMLEGLSYDALLDEATSTNGKANLERYKSTDTTFEYQLHFMRDKEVLLDALQPDYYEKDGNEVVLVENPNRMFRPLLKGIDKFKADGLWTDEQWKECRWTIETIEKQFEERLRQFAAAYDYKTEQQPQHSTTSLQDLLPEQLRTNNKAVEYIQRAIKANMIQQVSDGLRWVQIGKRGKHAQVAYFVGELCGYKDGGFRGNVGNRVSYGLFEKLFDEKRLDRALKQVYEAKPQWWRKKIDALFE